MKIKLHNYQIHSDTELDIDGLVGIVGSNNNGKTAIIRSLKDFPLNTFGEEKIKQGQKSGYIDVDGTRLTRHAKTSVLSLPDGTTIEKLAGQKIAKVTKLKDFLYIDNIRISNLLPQFVFQRETPFPFNLSNAQIYYVFSMLFDIEKLNKLFLYSKEKIKKNTADITYNKGKLDESLKMYLNLEEKKSRLPSIDEINKLEYKYKSYVTIIDDATKLQNDKIRHEHLKSLKLNLRLKYYLNLYKLKKRFEAFHYDASNEKILNLIEKVLAKKTLKTNYEAKNIILQDLELQKSKIKICSECGRPL